MNRDTKQGGTPSAMVSYVLNMPGEIRNRLKSQAEQSNLKLAKLLRLYITTMLLLHRELSDYIKASEEPVELSLPRHLLRYVKAGQFLEEVQEGGHTRLILESSNGKEVTREVLKLLI